MAELSTNHAATEPKHACVATPTEVLAALERPGWEINADEPHAIEASDGERFGVGIFFQDGVPVEICYGDGELDMQHSEAWTEAPGLLRPEEVVRLFSDEEGEQG
jgi:hypothetical protein